MKPFEQIVEESRNAPTHTLTNPEVSRYARQLVLPEVGSDGQDKIKAGKVLVVGAGGLGSSALLYLAAAGVGQIGVVDGDSVDVSNLHRQVIHRSSREGQNKAESAKVSMLELNPLISVVAYPVRLDENNSRDIVPLYDLIVDGTDNAASRYFLSDLAVHYKKPLVFGAALRWEGHVTLFNYNNGPCYRCIFPQAPPIELQCNCSDAGVIGLVPGIIGQLQAVETIKVLLGIPSLSGKLLIYDALESSFRKVTMRGKDEVCPACAANSTIDPHTYDYAAFLAPRTPTKSHEELLSELPEINKATAEAYRNVTLTQKHLYEEHILVDVRQPLHYSIVHLPNAVNIPLGDLDRYIEELRQASLEKTIFMFCRRGISACKATHLLLSKGITSINYADVKLIVGGLQEYHNVDPSLPSY